MPMSNWPRWVKASLAVSFAKSLSPEFLLIEGAEENSKTPPDRYELRVDGPTITEDTEGNYNLAVYVNLLIRVISKDNIYKIEDWKGRGLVAFQRSILLSRLTLDQDGTPIDCMQRDGQVIVTDFFNVASPADVQHATIEGCYRINLNESD